MIKFSTKGRYALRALVDLADISDKKNCSVSLKEVAERQDISIKYLEALFSVLKNNGIIQSKRGAHGGYNLSRPASEITAREVVEAIEGPISVVDCCVENKFCDKTNTCKTINLWKETNQVIVEKLQSTTLQSLIP